MTAAVYPVVGFMQMPTGFRYKEVLRRGRPKHEKYDSFWIRHPPMPTSRWAKIFAPFDALRGFREAIAAKDVPDSNTAQISREEPDEERNGITYE